MEERSEGPREDAETGQTMQERVNARLSVTWQGIRQGVSSPQRFRVTEEAQGRVVYAAGRFLIRLGPWLYPALLFVPYTAIIALYGLVPLPSYRETGLNRGTGLFIFVTSPFVFVSGAYLMASVFFGTLEGVDRPFRACLSTPVFVYAVQVGVFGTLVVTHGTFNLYGLAALGTSYVAMFLTIFVLVHREQFQENWQIKPEATRWREFFAVTLTIWLFILFLTAYIFAYRSLDGPAQGVLPPLLAIVLFIFRKVALALTDPLPMELAMLVSAFWFENIEDVFTVLAYPVVQDASTFVILWFTNAVSTLANLFFLTRRWFAFRIWIKHKLKHLCTCSPVPPTPLPDESDIPDERGHSNNRPGYHRRQVRFYLWKVVSQISAILLYLSVSPVLRFGINDDKFLFREINTRQYRNSMIFASTNLFFVCSSGILGLWYIRNKVPEAYTRVKEAQLRDLSNLTYIGFVVAIFTHNSFIALAIIMENMKIWYAFNKGEPTLE